MRSERMHLYRGRSLALALALALVTLSSPACKRRHHSHRARSLAARTASSALSSRAALARAAMITRNDADGDGLGDVLVADAPLGVELLRGARRGALSTSSWRWSPSLTDATRVRVGAMAFTGDLDGDHRSEVAIAEVPVTRESDPCAHGGVRIYRGAQDGLSPEPAWRLEDAPPMGEGTDHYALVGAQLARVDGLDGPGTFGLVVSARRTRVALVHASDGGDGGDAATTSETDSRARSEFCQGDELWVYRGSARTPSQRIVVNAGDVQRVVVAHVDRDAWPELVVLAPPRVLIYRGRAGGFEEAPAATLNDPHDDPQRWSDVAVGDVDGDGDGEIVVTFQYSSASEGVARAGIVQYEPLSDARREGALSAPSSSTAEGAAGRSVLVVRDADGDGRDEIVLADPTQRAVFVYRGRADESWPTPDRVLRVPDSAGDLGVTLVSAGDVNGDHREEILVRASRDDGGMATLYFADPLRGELERVARAPGAQGYGYSLAGHGSAMGGSAPRELAPAARRCVVPSAQQEPERLVTVSEPALSADRARVASALRAKLPALAACHERALGEDCNLRARASLTLRRDPRGTVTVAGIAWLDPTSDALRDCVQNAFTAPLLESSRPGADGPVELLFHEGP
jgi:hypothetical protein